jgi:hypothetical protein
MRPEQAQPPTNPQDNLWWVRRLGVIVTVWCLVYVATRPSPQMADVQAPPSGFLAGVRHGASMPLALPRLMLGHDTTIYALSNTGRTYKLGYTAGVNGCGALFFGITYWRFTRWAKSRKAA